MASERSVVISKMKRAYHENASRIDFGTLRHEADNRCPQCRQRNMWSVKFEGDTPQRNRKGEWEEPCGHYCASCGWGNAGSRAVDEADAPESNAHDVASLPEDAATGDAE